MPLAGVHPISAERTIPPPLPPALPPDGVRPTTAPWTPGGTRLLITLACLAWVAGIGLVDYAVVVPFDFHLLYFAPIAIAAWSAGWLEGYVIAAMATAGWLGADLLSKHQAEFWTYRPWNAILQLAAFLIIAYAAARIRTDYEEQKRLAAELKDALHHVKQLKGLLPICAWCKRVRDDQGYWHQVEAYVSDHTDAVFSHGVCPECQKKVMDEAQQHRETTAGKSRRSHARGSLGKDVPG